MLLRTHFALSVLIASLFLPHVSNKLVFAGVLLLATILPDADAAYSRAGRNFFSKILQVFVSHRGMFHSLTFCFAISLILAIFLPSLSLAFFLGYGFHIFLDSFTKDGVMPFWPWTRTSSGIFRTGGKSEASLFVILAVIDVIALVVLFGAL